MNSPSHRRRPGHPLDTAEGDLSGIRPDCADEQEQCLLPESRSCLRRGLPWHLLPPQLHCVRGHRGQDRCVSLGAGDTPQARFCPQGMPLECSCRSSGQSASRAPSWPRAHVRSQPGDGPTRESRTCRSPPASGRDRQAISGKALPNPRRHVRSGAQSRESVLGPGLDQGTHPVRDVSPAIYTLPSKCQHIGNPHTAMTASWKPA